MTSRKQKPLQSGQNRRNGGGGGAPCRIRTDDPRFTRAVLWPTELRRHAPKTTLDKVSPDPPPHGNHEAGQPPQVERKAQTQGDQPPSKVPKT